MIMRLDVTMMSMFGLVALTGVVVNDSLVMVDFINRARAVHADVGRRVRRAGGTQPDRDAFDSTGLKLAIREAGSNRFRPILLTSLTTFFGLAPLMLERSMQAAFLVPMAVSLAFGVLFATFITLILVPTAYLILDDIQRFARGMTGRGASVMDETADLPLPADGVAAPMAYFPFSGWKDSFLGVLHGQGRDAVEFYTEKKVVIERWPREWSRKF